MARTANLEKLSGKTDDISDAMSGSDVAVLIVNYRTPRLTELCLAALSEERNRVPRLKALVIDGGSGDTSVEQLAQYTAQSVFREWVVFLPLPLNGGFGWANNQGILRLAGSVRPPKYIYLLNPDAEVRPGALTALLQEMEEHPRCGAAGSQLMNRDGGAAASAFTFPSPQREFASAARSERLARLFGIAPTVVSSDHSMDVDWVTGASVLLRSEALQEAGLFDDGFFLYFEEVELMHRLSRKGWHVRHVPRSRVIHLEGASTGVGARSCTNSLPLYWYQSRSRYFSLTGGSSTLLRANLAALLGAALGARKRLSSEDHSFSVHKLLSRMRIGRSTPNWGDPPGKPPAWMSSGE